MVYRVGLGGDDENGPKRRQTRRLGHWYVFFFFHIFLCTNYSQRRPTQAHSTQRKPTQPHSTQRKPAKPHGSQQWPMKANAGPQQPIMANEGQHRPTKPHSTQQKTLDWAAMTKTGPNNARHVVWAIGMFFFSSTFFYEL